MKQLDNMVLHDVFCEVKYEFLPSQHHKWALPILLFIVMKHNRTLNTRACAGGQEQRVQTNKGDESSSSKSSIGALKYTLVVDTKEENDIATATVVLLAQFLQMDMDENLLLKIGDPLVLLLIESDPPKWNKYLIQNNGHPVICDLCK